MGIKKKFQIFSTTEALAQLVKSFQPPKPRRRWSYSQGIFLLFLAVCLSSCLRNNQFSLLQKKDVNKKDLPTDKVLRNYTIPLFEYHVQPSDIISVRFESLTDKEFDFLNRGTSVISGANIIQAPLVVGELVDPAGEIQFPVLGKVKVSGLTVFQIEEKLQKLASQFLETPLVKVRLLNLRVTLLGEVFKEGTILLNNNRVTMLEAIAQQGGLSDLADRGNIKLIRQKGDTVEVLYLNLLTEDFINSPYYYVHQNDILIVPPLRQRSFRKYAATNLGLILSALTLVLITINLTKN